MSPPPLVSALLELSLLGAPVLAAPPPLVAPAACPADMRLVQGTHHEQLQRLCVRPRGSKCFGFFPGLVLREPRVTPVSVCMDTFEWPNRAGARPDVMMTFVEAEASCASLGKRMCTELEWELACEGPSGLPWPYGFAKEDGGCNQDLPYRGYRAEALHSADKRVRDREAARLYRAAPSGSFARCVSTFGVADLVGNVEEWVTTSRPQWPHRSSLKGGYWSKPWSGCRGTNERHGPEFRFYEIGFRCCRAPEATRDLSRIAAEAVRVTVGGSDFALRWCDRVVPSRGMGFSP